MKSIVITLVSIASIAICGLIWIQLCLAPANFGLEIVKALLNILAVAVITPIVALVVTRYNEKRTQQVQADKIRYRTLDVLNNSFVETKKIRRRVRAKLEFSVENPEKPSIPRQLYFQSLEQLNDIQLKLEVIAKNIESYAELFSSGKNIFEWITSMEEYLNKLINEWEHHRPDFKGSPPKTDASELPCFYDLIAEYKVSDFRTEFIHCYYHAITGLRNSLIITKAATWKKRRR